MPDARDERVARAICRAMAMDPDAMCFVDQFRRDDVVREAPLPNWWFAVRVARAAIEAGTFSKMEIVRQEGGAPLSGAVRVARAAIEAGDVETVERGA